jgi:TadE-like protein
MKSKFRGQAAVETAIVLPLFVFTMLGMVQLGLMNQARLMTKYAAYKAVRAGALHRGKVDVMENAALAVLTPMVGQDTTTGGVMKIAAGGGDKAENYLAAFSNFQATKSNKQGNVPISEVRICAPYEAGQVRGDFDDPNTTSMSDWKRFERTKLSAEVTFYYRMFIPFANGMIWYSARANEATAQVRNTMKFLRMNHEGAVMTAFDNPNGKSEADVTTPAKAGKYILPLRASYSMRMQSNWDPGVDLSGANRCHINWPKAARGGSGSGGARRTCDGTDSFGPDPDLPVDTSPADEDAEGNQNADGDLGGLLAAILKALGF